MKNNKHKITREIQKEIYLIASDLPPVGKFVDGNPVYKWVETPGTEVTKDDLKPGTPIIREATYRIKRLVYEDHIQNMIKLVQRDGVIAINQYQTAVNAQVTSFKKADARANSLIKKFIKLIKSIWTKKRAR